MEGYIGKEPTDITLDDQEKLLLVDKAETIVLSGSTCFCNCEKVEFKRTQGTLAIQVPPNAGIYLVEKLSIDPREPDRRSEPDRRGKCEYHAQRCLYWTLSLANDHNLDGDDNVEIDQGGNYKDNGGDKLALYGTGTSVESG